MAAVWPRYILAGMLAISSGVVAAYGQTPAPAVSVAVGAGTAFPFHGDFDFIPWTWESDVRVALSSRVLLEGAAGEWRHSRTTVTTDTPGASPGSTIGRIEQTASHTRRTWHASLLATGGVGRVRMSGGGGVGVLQHRRRTVTHASACSPGAVCGTFDSSNTTAATTVHGVGDIDVQFASHVFVFARVRLVAPAVDPVNSDVRVLTGVRWAW